MTPDTDALILVLWNCGRNTKEIADRLGIPEHEVERRFHHLKDRLHAENAA